MPDQQSSSPGIARGKIVNALTARRMPVDVPVAQRPARRIELYLSADLIDVIERVVADEVSFVVGRWGLFPSRPHGLVRIDTCPEDVVQIGKRRFPGAVLVAIVLLERKCAH